jgi:hypothetical protein
MYYYLYRFYDPNLQRWINRDPIGEDTLQNSGRSKAKLAHRSRSRRTGGSDNLYEFVKNSPPMWVDRSGLDIWVGHRPFGLFGIFEHWNINVGDPSGTYTSYSFSGNVLDWWGDIYVDTPLHPSTNADIYTQHPTRTRLLTPS